MRGALARGTPEACAGTHRREPRSARPPLAAVNAVGNADPVIGVAGQLQDRAVRPRGPRSAPPAAGGPRDTAAWSAANGPCRKTPARRWIPKSGARCCQHQRPSSVVGHFGQLRPPGPAHEDPQQHLPLRGTVRVFLAAEAAGQDRAVLDRRHHRAHAVQRMADLPPVVAQRDDGRARVLDLAQLRGQLGVDRRQQPRRPRATARPRSGRRIPGAFGGAQSRYSPTRFTPPAPHSDRPRRQVYAATPPPPRSIRSTGEFSRTASGRQAGGQRLDQAREPVAKRDEHAVAGAAFGRGLVGRVASIWCRIARIRLPCCCSISRKRESVASTLSFSMSAA